MNRPVLSSLMLYDIAPNIAAFSTERHTEESDLPYAGFNVTPYTGDLPSHVASCHEQLASSLHISPSRIIIPHQVHGTRIAIVDEQFLTHPDDRLEGVDAVVSNLIDVCLGVSTADCVPLLFYDPKQEVIGATHAGWRGTVARIGVLTLAKMYESFGSSPQDVLCLIGPSIGPEAFEVREDVYDSFRLAGFPMDEIATAVEQYEHFVPPRWRINLWKANAWQLQCAGLPARNISITGICTYTDYARFFSARRLGIQSGRIYTGILRRGNKTY